MHSLTRSLRRHRHPCACKPRSWTGQAFPKLIHFNKVAKGGHFAAWEQPKIFAEEVRAGFKSLH